MLSAVVLLSLLVNDADGCCFFVAVAANDRRDDKVEFVVDSKSRVVENSVERGEFDENDVIVDSVLLLLFLLLSKLKKNALFDFEALMKNKLIQFKKCLHFATL